MSVCFFKMHVFCSSLHYSTVGLLRFGVAVTLLHGRLNKVTLRLTTLILGWVTVFGRANHLSISPSHSGQLSLLPSVGREVSTSQSAVILCGWGVKVCMAHSTCGSACGWQVKLCDHPLTRAIPERLGDEFLMTKRYTNLRLLYFTLVQVSSGVFRRFAIPTF